MSPANTLVRSLVEPLALPMDTFHANWKLMNDCLKDSLINQSKHHAHKLLVQHALRSGRPAILGKPYEQLANDYKFKANIEQHERAGEILAQAAL